MERCLPRTSHSPIDATPYRQAARNRQGDEPNPDPFCLAEGDWLFAPVVEFRPPRLGTDGESQNLFDRRLMIFRRGVGSRGAK